MAIKLAEGMLCGELTVLRKAGFGPDRKAQWLCRCSCGTEKLISQNRLNQGRVKSCGCRQHEIAARSKSTHGHAPKRNRSPEYRSWGHMINRCENRNDLHWAWYGQRGISVCPRWRNGENGVSAFECFLADMGKRPTLAHTLDRWPDVNGNYEPKNCRWATKSEQMYNMRRTLFVEYHGQKRCLKEVSRVEAVDYNALRHRVIFRKVDLAAAIQDIRTNGFAYKPKRWA